MASLGTITRLNLKLRSVHLIKTNYEEGPYLGGTVLQTKPNLAEIDAKSFCTSQFILDRSKGLAPYDPDDAPEFKDLRTPFVPNKRKHSLWKTTKDGVKNTVSTPEDRREVKHPSLFYRQDHKDIGYLFRSTRLEGHDSYKGYRPRSNSMVVTLSLMALLVHMMTRDENEIDEYFQKQGWYRLLWLDASYDSSKDPRSNKEIGKTLIGVPLIGQNTLLNNSKDE